MLKNFTFLSIFYGKFIFNEELSYIKNSNISKEELELEYTRLFYGPNKMLCPPYESMYKENRIFGEATLSVINFYGKYNYKLNDEITEVPDHISLELEFMNMLCKKGLIDAQYAFLIKHLLPFVKKFRRAIEEYSIVLFYKKLTKLMEKFLILDSHYLNFLLSEQRK